MSVQHGGEAPGRVAEPAHQAKLPTPGAMIAGRYRLLEKVGDDRQKMTTLWRAKDTVLDRDVGLTVLTGLNARATLRLAAAIAPMDHPGLARVLDVLTADQLGVGLSGLVVSEWVSGASVASLSVDAVDQNRPLPSGVVARALAPVASAVDAAHRAGLVLGVDHPQRVRIGRDGLARVAFPVVSTTSTPGEDVRGLGALLYVLLTGKWPLPDPPAGLPGVPMSDTGSIVGPRAIRPAVSLTLATLAERCVAGGVAGGIYSGAAVYQVLDQTATAEQDTVLMPVVAEHGVEEILRPVSYDDEGEVEAVESSRRRKLAIGLVVLGSVTILLVALVAAQLADFFAGDSGQAPTIAVERSEGSGDDDDGNEGEEPPRQLTEPVQPAGIVVFDPSGNTPDNPGRVGNAIDGDPTSTWKTYDYNDPFPALKPGVGVIISFADTVPLGGVVIDSPSAGSRVEIRSAPSATPAFEQTELISTATLGAGRTEIPFDRVTETQYLVIWITELAVRDGLHVTELGDVTLLRADD